MKLFKALWRTAMSLFKDNTCGKGMFGIFPINQSQDAAMPVLLFVCTLLL